MVLIYKMVFPSISTFETPPNPGTIDGTLGPQTQQALRWFQNAKGLVATGDLDEKTLNALEVR
jgi:peptidoglycan hydrolase-like protein with peptidoglycan-binding domain